MADEDANSQDQQELDAPDIQEEGELTAELTAARESDPETTVVDDADKPSEESQQQEEDKPDDSKEEPADQTDPTQPDQPADQENPGQPDTPDVSKMSKEERKEFFLELQRQREQQDREEVARKLDEHYQPQDSDALKQKYLDEGYSDFEATMLARDERREQAAQINEVRSQVVQLNAQINQESLQVMHDFPVFDPDSPEFDAEFRDKAAALYQQTAGTVVDEQSGVVLRTNVLPYAFYKNLSELRDAGLSQAQIKAQQNAEKQLASVQPSGSATPAPAAPAAEDEQASRLENAFNNVV